MKLEGLRLSIRYKMLAVIACLLLLAMGTYLYLATSLFTRDKLAYVYDINSALVETVARETRVAVEILVREAGSFAEDVTRPDATPERRVASATRLFAGEPEIVRVQVWTRAEGGGLKLAHSYVHEETQRELGLTKSDLDSLHGPPSLDAIAAGGDSVRLRNSSRPPDAGILTMEVALVAGAMPAVVVLDLRHERLLRLFGRLRQRETYLVGTGGELLAHPSAERVISRASAADDPLVKDALLGSVQTGAKEFTEGKITYLGAFARVGRGGLAVATRVDRREALLATGDFLRRSVFFGLAILLATFVVSVVFSRLLTAPIRDLLAATERLSAGRFDIEIRPSSNDEIGDLARSFDRMARTIKETEAQMIHSARMAAFGQLGAGITHEVKNPVAGILGMAQLARMRLDDRAKVEEYLQIIEKEATRCRDILARLLTFARADRRQTQRVDIGELVSDVAKMVKHQLSVHDVLLEVEIDPATPAFEGIPAEIEQVLLNLALNAQQAMPRGGRVRMTARPGAEKTIVLAMEDTGPGIPPALLGRIFEPFFTTKQPGEGTGLGLSVAHRIVQEHGGRIEVREAQGGGALFEIVLPAKAGEEGRNAESGRRTA